LNPLSPGRPGPVRAPIGADPSCFSSTPAFALAPQLELPVGKPNSETVTDPADHCRLDPSSAQAARALGAAAALARIGVWL
jgi:hypothetical protein